jgi:hypothetical protein
VRRNSPESGGSRGMVDRVKASMAREQWQPARPEDPAETEPYGGGMAEYGWCWCWAQLLAGMQRRSRGLSPGIGMISQCLSPGKHGSRGE